MIGIKFDLLYFCCRYLAGGEALRAHRTISRKRISLARAGIAKNDLAACDLVAQIDRFYNSLIYLKNKKIISMDDILSTHKTVARSCSLSGQLRDGQNWVGKSIQESTYIPPSHHELPALLRDIVYQYNDYRLTEFLPSQAIEIYSRFILAHPFFDGNGRCARALFLSMSPEVNVPPILYRISSTSQNNHREAVLEYQSRGGEHMYWSELKKWGEEKTSNASFRIREYRDYVFSIIPFVSIDKNVLDIINYATNITFFSLFSLSAFVRRSHIDLRKDFDFLLGTGFIREFRCNNGFVFYECPSASKLHDDIEKIIVSSREI